MLPYIFLYIFIKIIRTPFKYERYKANIIIKRLSGNYPLNKTFPRLINKALLLGTIISGYNSRCDSVYERLGLLIV